MTFGNGFGAGFGGGFGRGDGAARLAAGRSGIPLALALNGVAGTPLAAYRGRDATLTTWPAKVGQTVTLGGASTNPTLGVSSGKSNVDDAIAVTFADPGNYYAAGNNAYLDDDGTSDYVAECVFNTGASTGTEDTVFSKYDPGSGGAAGFLFYRTPAGLMGGTGRFMTAVTSMAASTWFHVLFVARRGGNCRFYINGTLSSSSAVGGMAAAASPFQFNAYFTTHSSPGPCSLAWFAMWSGVNLCAGTTAEMDALAAARSKACGF